jgi:hypothetical protein
MNSFSDVPDFEKEVTLSDKRKKISRNTSVTKVEEQISLS